MSKRRPNSNMKEKAKKLVSAALKSAVGYSIYKAAYQLEQEAINKAKTKVKDATLYTIYISKSNVTNGCLVAMLRRDTPKYHAIIDGKFEDASTGVGTAPQSAGLYVRFYNKTPIFINLNDVAPNYSNPPSFVNRVDYPFEYSPVGVGRGRRSRDDSIYGISCSPVLTPSPVYTTNNGSCFITVSTLNNKKMIHDMKIWLKNVIKKSEEDRWKLIDGSKTIELSSNRDDIMRSMKKRSMETVFIDEKIKKDIMDSLDAFVCNREWYDDNFIPYHYGILLHGPAGTGKSTLIRAILTEYYKKYSKQGYTIENPSYLSSPSDLLGINEEGYYGPAWAPRIIIIEDIDATVLKKRIPEEEEKPSEDGSNEYMPQKRRLYYQEDLTSLSEILNKMDGVANVENVIYIFTTNHIDQLDTALTRPGRIDKIVEIKMPRREDYDAFMFYHFKKHIPDNIVIRTNKLIAELQTDIVCKKTYEEMLEILQKED